MRKGLGNGQSGPKLNLGLRRAQTNVIGESEMAENPQIGISRGEIGLDEFRAGPASTKLASLTRNKLIKRRKCSERWNFEILSTRVRPERPN